jgi:uncharacterized protein GlcG (DUF336 family)
VTARNINPDRSEPFSDSRPLPTAVSLEEIPMSKLFVSKTALYVAGVALAAAFALSAGSANAQLVARKDISAAMAMTMAETAVATCKANGFNVSVNVVGRNGEIIVMMRGDNTGPHTLENSMKKAYTARSFRRPSGDFGDSIKDNFTAGALHLTNIVPARGALPITVGEEVIGAIGVSGAPGGDKDEACAKAGIEKVAADLK